MRSLQEDRGGATGQGGAWQTTLGTGVQALQVDGFERALA